MTINVMVVLQVIVDTELFSFMWFNVCLKNYTNNLFIYFLFTYSIANLFISQTTKPHKITYNNYNISTIVKLSLTVI